MTHPTTPITVLALVPPEQRPAVAAAAADARADVAHVDSVAVLLERLRERPWSATLLSLSVDPADARLARRIAAEDHAGALLVSTPRVTLGDAVGMERLGVTALLSEPLDAAALAPRLAGLSDDGAEVRLPEPEAEGDGGPPLLVGSSAGMAGVVERIARVARSDATVLVRGESGTGKEVVARALHWASARGRGPFVAVNCAAIPEHLLESELFGHERGAFTGAVARRVGRFERANGGTLFLDEIGDMSVVLQAKVLRALEERSVDPVGGSESRPIDARVVAATNRDLAGAIAEGSFREDLYYRLAVVEVHLPPLRERGGDVRELALHFAAALARRHDRPVAAITEGALRLLEEARWPGNVRELRNVIDRAVLLCRGGSIRSADLRVAVGTGGPAREGPPAEYDPARSLADVERDHIRRVLASVDGHMGRAAEILGIHRNTLTRKVQAYGLDEGGSAPGGSG